MADGYRSGIDGYVDRVGRRNELPKSLFNGSDAATLKGISIFADLTD
jgi:hypothetical protein